jgi:branched-chain amino acid transport system substrate-binding protein
MRRFGLFIAVAVLASALASCGGSGDSGGGSDGKASGEKADKSPIVVGQALAASGFMVPYDKSLKLGAQMAADDINAKGGVLGRKIEFEAADTKSDATQAGQAALKLLDGGADFLLATCDYDLGAPIAQAGEQAGIPTAGCAGGLQWGAQGLGPLTYNFYPGSATEGRIMADLAYRRGARKPFLLVLNDYEYTKTMCKYFKTRWAELGGGAIAGEDTLKDSDASIDSQISNIRSASGVDSVVLCSFPPSGASAVKQLRAAGIDQKLILASDFDGDYWLKAIPNLSDAYYPSIGSIFDDDPNPAHRDLFERVKQKTGKRPEISAYVLMGYSMIEAMAKAMQKAGSTDGKAVAAALDTFKDVPLAEGKFTYTPNCHIPQTLTHLEMEIQKGKPKFTGKQITPTVDPKAPC